MTSRTETKRVAEQMEIGRTWDESVPAFPPEGQAPTGPNVVFWVMDDVGYGQLSTYGGLIPTPTLDRLAARGQTFTNAHATPVCAPTRAALMTGRNHHSNHMASVPRFSAEFPGHDSRIPLENGFLSQVLSENGYATFAVGKWHLTSIDELSMAASRHNWPLGRGFDRYYGFLTGQTSQWEPHLVRDNHAFAPAQGFPEDYHLSEDLVDRSIDMIHDLRAADPTRPFFLYLAFGAGHAPHHAPKEWVERFRGRFDAGWDAYREEVLENQKRLGIWDADVELSREDPDVPRWSSLTDREKRSAARLMEAFAGMVAHMDHQVGRLISELEALGELDRTAFFATSDNGASSEGGRIGSFNNQQFQGGIPQSPPDDDQLELVGGRDSYPHYPWGWAWAGNTPFRRWKRETYRGGCSVPFVFSWPGQLNVGLRSQFVHSVDLMPTVLDLLGIDPPAVVNGLQQQPMEGTSFVPVLSGDDAAPTRTRQYFEMYAHRSMYVDGWRAVCPWPGASFAESGRTFPSELTGRDMDLLEESDWELYHVAEDPSELHDLAAEHPEKLRELIAAWWEDAHRYNVLPVIGARPHGTASGVAQDAREATRRFYPGTAPTWVETAIGTVNASHRIIADVYVETGRESGVLLALGGRFGGYSLYLQDGVPHYVYSAMAKHEKHLAGAEPLVPGDHVVAFEFDLDDDLEKLDGWGLPGRVRLRVDGTVVAEDVHLETVPVALSFAGTLTCGWHPAEAFTNHYTAPYTFEGKLRHVTVSTTRARLRDLDAETDVAFVVQ